MSDANTGAEPADDSAGEADKTDEQVWEDIQADETAAKPDETSSHEYVDSASLPASERMT